MLQRLLLPPIVFLACACTAGVLPGAVWGAAPLRTGLAAGPALVGLILLIWARRSYVLHDSEIHTFAPPRGLVTTGPFRYTRNPMYLGFLGILVGIATLAGTLAAWGPVVLFFGVCQAWYVPFEERATRATFGTSYVVWAARTPRWIGVSRRT